MRYEQWCKNIVSGIDQYKKRTPQVRDVVQENDYLSAETDTTARMLQKKRTDHR